MKLFLTQNIRLIFFYLIIILIACSPIWGVEYFINQDGSPHLYNAFLMAELMKGNQFFLSFCAINSVPVPNQSGAWVLTGLLQFFQPFLVTKLMMTFTYAFFVASVGWLRYRSAGRDCLKTSLIIGAALGFHGMWFMGFYNFSIGVSIFVFTLGAFFGWGGRINVQRAIVLALSQITH